jgi:membrane-associated phospholipid phosphatase
MYRGEHHPTDILGSLLFAALWLTATYLLIKPNADRDAQARAGRPRRATERRNVTRTAPDRLVS